MSETDYKPLTADANPDEKWCLTVPKPIKEYEKHIYCKK